MPWTIELTYVGEHDYVLTRYADVVLRHEGDAVRWRAEVDRQFERLGARHGRSKFDVLIDLDGLDVRPTANDAYGRHRVRVIERYCLKTFRFGGNSTTRTGVFTTSVLLGAHANVFPTREEAEAALLAARRDG